MEYYFAQIVVTQIFINNCNCSNFLEIFVFNAPEVWSVSFSTSITVWNYLNVWSRDHISVGILQRNNLQLKQDLWVVHVFLFFFILKIEELWFWALHTSDIFSLLPEYIAGLFNRRSFWQWMATSDIDVDFSVIWVTCGIISYSQKNISVTATNVSNLIRWVFTTLPFSNFETNVRQFFLKL